MAIPYFLVRVYLSLSSVNGLSEREKKRWRGKKGANDLSFAGALLRTGFRDKRVKTQIWNVNVIRKGKLRRRGTDRQAITQDKNYRKN